MMGEHTAAAGSDQPLVFGQGAVGLEPAIRPSWLICRAGNVLCALPIEHVVEIMRLLPIQPLAGAPDYVRGVSIVRGAPVPVVDAGLVIGNGSGESTRLVAIRTGPRIVALAVAAIVGITAVGADTFAQLPPLLRDAASETVTAIGARDGELLVCLQSGRLISDDALARLDEAGMAS